MPAVTQSCLKEYGIAPGLSWCRSLESSGLTELRQRSCNWRLCAVIVVGSCERDDRTPLSCDGPDADVAAASRGAEHFRVDIVSTFSRGRQRWFFSLAPALPDAPGYAFPDHYQVDR